MKPRKNDLFAMKSPPLLYICLTADPKDQERD